MEISIGSYKFRVEILIAIVIVFWIMFGHILCGCCRYNIVETMVSGTPGRKVAAANVYQTNNTTNNTTDDSTSTSTSTSTTTEGFTSLSNSSMGPEFSNAQSSGYIMNPSTWSMPTLTYSPGTTPDAGVQAIWDRPKQPIPLPEGQLFMFATTPFKPECCPNAYSTSTGCACMTVDQYNFLRERGSNNVPYSEY